MAFRFKRGSEILRWSGLLANQRLLLDSSAYGDQERLKAMLQFAELKTDVTWVLVSVRRTQEDRDWLLRALSYVGFEVMKPNQPLLPSCRDAIFLVYTLQRPAPEIANCGGAVNKVSRE